MSEKEALLFLEGLIGRNSKEIGSILRDLADIVRRLEKLEESAD